VTDAPLRVLQFTDLHLFGDPARRLRGVPTLDSAAATLAAARDRHPAPDALLLTGDLVQDDAAGYAHLRRLFAGSPAPVHCIPGNHDVADAFGPALSAAPFRVGGHHRHGRWLFVMLDSTVAGRVGGHLAAAELARLDAALGAHPALHALVCLHHQPTPAGSRWLDAGALANGPELFAVLDRHPNVRALAFGHVHQAYAERRRGVQLLATPSTGGQFAPGSDDFATDDRPPAYRWLALAPDGGVESGVEWLDGWVAPSTAR
jgi:Icc protein